MKIEVGKVLKAQGIKGELKVGCSLDDASMLKNVKQLYLGIKSYPVVCMRCNGNVFYVLLQGIADRNAAESVRGCAVFADKDAVNIAEDRYFVDDLVGCRVICDGVTLGEVDEVLQYGAADVFVCKTEGKGFSFPFLKDVVDEVNIDCKRITVEKKRFEEVVVYED